MRKITTSIGFCFFALVVLAVWSPTTYSYPTYSEGKITNPAGQQEAYGYCKTCHGHFRATDETNNTAYLRDEYISPTDGKPWREYYQEVEATEPAWEVGLHDVHRHIILDKIGSSRCNVCHSSGGRYPVLLNSSATTDLEPISCVGCHGRNEDMGNDSTSEGRGAGLRQHHTNSGVKECKTCHADADPARYTPVGEDVLPSFYKANLSVFPNIPTDPCNKRRAEDYAGKPKGLDNDGDGLYDQKDPDCYKK